ncbi:NAD(P)-dependent oxidoreductase [Methylobacterium sp. J-076]|uniref:NAD(P)-dependent oxidoreductase n=1 Tax=Methylobacterium sp. J-076 TaxID=2836655 RepID=UPI001FB9B50D|nr:NAD(P)-dependent oxidoreductase [Methylobacterium sp. J-076]MCJ2011527.1 NAD(P)-dependent oxidoreductase [Methylobacterium sp. J-076]
MNVALIGATGNAGARILSELSQRGHSVTAIVRNPAKVPSLPRVSAKAGNVYDQDGLAALIKGHDVVISSVHFTASDPHKLLAAVKASGVARYLVVGGAGSLEVAPGVKVIDTPDFPPQYKAEAAAGGVYLDILRGERELDWTFLSPSALFIPGERTGTFRLGKDELLANDQGSSISFEDYAIALVDELERPAHSRERFTVGY